LFFTLCYNIPFGAGKGWYENKSMIKNIKEANTEKFRIIKKGPRIGKSKTGLQTTRMQKHLA